MTSDTLPKHEEEAVVAAHDAADLADERAPVDPALFQGPTEVTPFERTVQTTPLHLETAAESRTNSWTNWNGYTVPEVLRDLDDEYRALRGAAVLMDLSPLVKYRIAGRDAPGFLERLVVVPVSSLAADRSRHVMFCDGGGNVIGDGLLFRLAQDEYRLVTEESHFDWLCDSAEGFRVRIEDVSATLAAIALQGPLSAFMLSELGAKNIAALEPGAARWTSTGGMPVYASRTGATGDLGYELWCDAEDAPHVWREVMNKMSPFGLRPAGFALRELARLEAGYPRAGKDYLSAFAAIGRKDALPPRAIWPSLALDPKGGVFNGAAALRAAAHAEPPRRIVRLAVEGLEPVRFASVSLGGRTVGTATSTGFSPALGANIALALVDSAAAGAEGLSVLAERRDGISVAEARLSARTLPEPAFAHPRRFQVPAPLRG